MNDVINYTDDTVTIHQNQEECNFFRQFFSQLDLCTAYWSINVTQFKRRRA